MASKREMVLRRPSKRHIGILAGTFDPPHLGHLWMALAALKQTDITYVEFLPCWKHAFGKTPVDFDHRVNMCKLMAQGYSHIGVSDLEGRLETNYSVDILNAYVQMHGYEYDHYIKESVKKDVKFSLIMGSDNYYHMDKWKNPEKVRELVGIIWVSRSSEDLLPEEETTIFIENNTSSHLRKNFSSTVLREYLKEGSSNAWYMTRTNVMDYILRNHLYTSTN